MQRDSTDCFLHTLVLLRCIERIRLNIAVKVVIRSTAPSWLHKAISNRDIIRTRRRLCDLGATHGNRCRLGTDKCFLPGVGVGCIRIGFVVNGTLATEECVQGLD